MKNTLDRNEMLSMKERFIVFNYVASLPAVSLMLWTRLQLGARILAPRAGLVSVFMLIGSCFITNENESFVSFVFSLFTLLIGIVERFSRWREHRRGKATHSYSIGTAGCRWLLPKFLKRNRFPEKILEPMFFFGVGCFIHKYVPIIGGWLIISACCLFYTEMVTSAQLYEDELDLVDGLVEGETKTESVDKFSPPTPVQSSHSQSSGIIPTGMAPDIAQNVQKLRSRRSKDVSQN